MQLPAQAGGGFLAIPAMRNLRLNASGNLSGAEVGIDSAHADSSLGSGEMRGTVGISGISPLALSGSAKLSPESQQRFGPLLPLATNNRVPAASTELVIHVSGTVRKPQLLIEAP